MNLEINQNNLYLLLPSKVAWMAESDDWKMNPQKCGTWDL